MNIFDFIKKPKKRSAIRDESTHPSAATRKAAAEFAERLHDEMTTIETLNTLLNAPLVVFNPDKYLRMTLPPREWLSDKPLIILFSIETDEPVCAYFGD